MSAQTYVLAIWLAGAGASAIYLTIARTPKWHRIAPELGFPATRSVLVAMIAFASLAWPMFAVSRLVFGRAEDRK